jgi:hypothetical protein
VPIAGRVPDGNVNKYIPEFRQTVAEAGREHEAVSDLVARRH